MEATPEQARILVVSASPYTRYLISGELSSEPDLFVVGTARTPDDIIRRQAMLRPDLAIVDLDSLRELSDLQRALGEVELPVLALCSYTRDGAELAFAALEAGAAEVVARSNGGVGSVNFVPDLLRKVRGLARIKPRTAGFDMDKTVPRAKTTRRRFSPGDRLIVVSASTGGLKPVMQLLTALPADLPASLLALTPLPACYLHWFLKRVDPSTALYLRQARDGLPLTRGEAYLAPHDYYITIGPRGFLTLDRSRFKNQESWSADMTLSSLATGYGPTVIGVVLSGIGYDGVRGTLDLRGAGGTVIVQDPLACLVDETPKAVIEAGAATVVLPPEEIADEIVRQVEGISGAG